MEVSTDDDLDTPLQATAHASVWLTARSEDGAIGGRGLYQTVLHFDELSLPFDQANQVIRAVTKEISVTVQSTRPDTRCI